MISGHLNTTQWLDQTFGNLTVNGLPIKYMLGEATPDVTVGANDVFVTASHSGSQGPVQSLRIGLTNQFPTMPSDGIVLHVNDYSVSSISPEPAEYDQGKATWFGIQSQNHIDLGVSYAGPGRLLYLLQRQPELPPGWDSLLFLLYAFYAIVPIVAVVWVALRLGTSSVGAEEITQAATVLLSLWIGATVLQYLEIVADILGNLLPTDYSRGDLGILEMWALRRVGFAAAIALVAAIACLTAIRLRIGRTARAVSIAVGRALLLSGVFVAVFEVTAWYLPNALPNTQWQAVSFGIGVVILATLGAYTLVAIDRIARGKSRNRILIWISLGALGIAAAIPWPARIYGTPYPYSSEIVRPTLAEVISILPSLGRITSFAVLVFLLKRAFPHDHKNARLIIIVIFATFVVGFYPIVIGLPVSFIVSLVIGRWLLQRPRRLAKMIAVRAKIRANRPRWLKAAFAVTQATELQHATIDSLDKRARSADLTLDEYQTRCQSVDDYVKERRISAAVSLDMNAEDVILVFGPKSSSFATGVLGLALGVVFAMPLILLEFAIGQWQYVGQVPYPILYAVVQLLATTVTWAAGGFFLGYFMSNLKFGSGLSKGLFLGLIVALVQLLGWITGFNSVAEATVTVLRTAYTIIFFSLIGLIFDYRTWRQAFDRRGATRAISEFAGVQPAAAAVSLALPSIGLTLLTALSGQFGQLVGLLLRLVPPTSPPATH